jgi:hypothetical protein
MFLAKKEKNVQDLENLYQPLHFFSGTLKMTLVLAKS